VSPLTDAQVDRLAWCSAGRLRDFMGMMRDVAVEAMLCGLDDADDLAIEAAVDQRRRDKEKGLNTAHIATLQSVLDDPKRRLPAGDEAFELLNRGLLLPYPNKKTWYLPHTLLTLELLAPATGSTASG